MVAMPLPEEVDRRSVIDSSQSSVLDWENAMPRWSKGIKEVVVVETREFQPQRFSIPVHDSYLHVV